MEFVSDPYDTFKEPRRGRKAPKNRRTLGGGGGGSATGILQGERPGHDVNDVRATTTLRR